MTTREPQPVVIDGANGRYILTCRISRLGGHGERRTIRTWTVTRFVCGVREPIGERGTLAAAKALVACHEI